LRPCLRPRWPHWSLLHRRLRRRCNRRLRARRRGNTGFFEEVAGHGDRVVGERSGMPCLAAQDLGSSGQPTICSTESGLGYGRFAAGAVRRISGGSLCFEKVMKQADNRDHCLPSHFCRRLLKPGPSSLAAPEAGGFLTGRIATARPLGTEAPQADRLAVRSVTDSYHDALERPQIGKESRSPTRWIHGDPWRSSEACVTERVGIGFAP